jgi:16S rRNA (guanine966-N2)-methyltransferase
MARAPLQAPRVKRRARPRDRTREALFLDADQPARIVRGAEGRRYLRGHRRARASRPCRGARIALHLRRSGPRCAQGLEGKNIAKLGRRARYRADPMAVSALGTGAAPCDLLMFDPPYGSGGAGALLEKMTRLGWAAPSGLGDGRDRRRRKGFGRRLDDRFRAPTYGKAKLSVLVREASQRNQTDPRQRRPNRARPMSSPPRRQASARSAGSARRRARPRR